MIDRRKLLKVATGAALGSTVAAVVPVLSATPAAATGEPTWPIVANGTSGELVFWRRLNIANAWDVGGGLCATMFGDPVLAFGYSIGGLNFVRVMDVDLNVFQVYRTLPSPWTDNNGPGGHFYQYVWNGVNFSVTGPYAWKAYDQGPGPQPWQMYVDDSPKSTLGVTDFKVTANGGTEWIREVHHFDDPSGRKNFWGRFTSQSTVGLTPTVLPVVGHSQFPDPDGSTWFNEYRQGSYSFFRALDTTFDRFQVFWGSDRRAWSVNNGSGFGYGSLQRWGQFIHFDVPGGSQTKHDWKTKVYP
ncbi:hypothetical protein OG474_41190 [Kribbella sp. NBC_01505]|uniref:hypothetical protein n=1 Tax=Kribbella sp. NBC_01505 TaxID=2903580 RepID=UPI003866748C